MFVFVYVETYFLFPFFSSVLFSVDTLVSGWSWATFIYIRCLHSLIRAMSK